MSEKLPSLFRMVTDHTESLLAVPPLTRDLHFNPGCNISRYKAPDGTLYHGFEDNWETNQPRPSKYIMAAMYLPGYLNLNEEVRGVFLLRTQSNVDWKLSDFTDDKSIGRHGCATRIYTGTQMVTTATGTELRHVGFEFNRMRFYPFLLRNLTVAFFVTDKNSDDDKIWYRDANRDGVAIQAQIQYNTTLDIFETRYAELK
jgi:hypothetical protein